MSRNNAARLAGLLKQCSPEVILRAASLCDGHTIFVPKAFIDAGLPPEVVEQLTTSHTSDGSPKGTIFVSGRAVQVLHGVYGLDLLRFFDNALGVDLSAGRRPGNGGGEQSRRSPPAPDRFA